MKALRRFADQPAAVPLVADDIIELHAGRLVLLIQACGGSAGAITGLTKMAKLDFFVRYPDFFFSLVGNTVQRTGPSTIEAAMVRHHYGPWDKRYYHVLGFLEARGLITISKSGKGRGAFRIALTKDGKAKAKELSASAAFVALFQFMQVVAEQLGSRTGNELKNLVYSKFRDEVANRPLGHVIGEGS